MKLFCLLVCLAASLSVLVPTPVKAQIQNPVKWSFDAVQSGESEVRLMVTATIDEGWHLYSQFISNDGPLPTTFTFTPSKDYSLIGKVKEEGSPVKSYDPTFMMDVIWFAKSVTFVQRVKLNIPSTVIKGKIEFMACTDEMCLPPQEIIINIQATANKSQKKKTNAQTLTPNKKIVNRNIENSAVAASTDTTNIEIQSLQTKTLVDSSAKVIVTNNSETSSAAQDQTLWAIFIAGFFGGLAALLMPCIFPMIPFTVGIFSKRGAVKDRSDVLLSIAFGISIILIYVTLGLLITIIFGSDALNSFATNGVLNFSFFLLLIIFAASFLGAFEINLPSSWVNRIDAQGERNGIIGIFFVAATLVLVSFSCTGPLIGTLLVEAASHGSYKGPIIGMLGFSIALALPFTIFSMFPGWMRTLPKSGGWLNSVKVVLGFLELALALKFLSNVDLAYHWEWFDREVFLVLWIIIFGLLGFYLLGKIHLPNDSEQTHISPPSLFLAVIVLAFTLYMIPGLWGAPLKVISAFLPPQHTQDFDLSKPTSHEVEPFAKKYSDIFHAPLNLNAFFDYEEAVAYAQKVKRPILIDFTGHACVNCRKMETVVWSDPRILNRIKHDYVLVQLYVDDKTELPVHEQFESTFSGKEITTIGNKWSDFQASNYNANSQPYYVLIDLNEKPLLSPQGAEYDIELFKQYLDNGLTEFKKR